jgi:hypothetical protein
VGVGVGRWPLIAPILVGLQILWGQLLGRYQSVVPFGGHGNTFFSVCQFKKSNQILTHELGCDGSTNQSRELLGTHGEILFDLNCAQSISASLRLHWKDVVNPLPINAYIELVGLDLACPLDEGSQVAL